MFLFKLNQAVILTLLGVKAKTFKDSLVRKVNKGKFYEIPVQWRRAKYNGKVRVTFRNKKRKKELRTEVKDLSVGTRVLESSSCQAEAGGHFNQPA